MKRSKENSDAGQLMKVVFIQEFDICTVINYQSNTQHVLKLLLY